MRYIGDYLTHTYARTYYHFTKKVNIDVLNEKCFYYFWTNSYNIVNTHLNCSLGPSTILKGVSTASLTSRDRHYCKNSRIIVLIKWEHFRR